MPQQFILRRNRSADGPTYQVIAVPSDPEMVLLQEVIPVPPIGTFVPDFPELEPDYM